MPISEAAAFLQIAVQLLSAKRIQFALDIRIQHSPNVSLDLSNNDPRAGWFEPTVAETEGNGKFAGFSHQFELGYIEVRGALQLGNVAALPAAEAFQRGKLIRVEGGPGAEDAVYTCIRQADGTYVWKRLLLG